MGAYAVPDNRPYISAKPPKTKTALTPEQKKMREEYKKYSTMYLEERKKLRSERRTNKA